MAFNREEIRQEARRIFAARGIDPDIAERVIRQESGFNPEAKNINPKERSYGLAQLNEQGGLGAVALQQGIDPKDPNQWRRHLEFMADTVKRDGWRQWYGARDTGVSRWQGVGSQGASAAPSTQTVANIQELQAKLLEKYPELRVTSGYRDPAHNAKVGGAKNSQHTHGRAIDLSLRGIEEARQREIVEYARQLGARGLGYYPNSQSVHFDVRPGAPAVWGQNYSRSSLPGTPKWFQEVAAQHMQGGGGIPATAQMSASAAAPPNSPLPNVAAPDRGVLADTPDPFKAIADAAKERQEQQRVQMEQMAAATAPRPAQPAPPPVPDVPPPMPADYAGLIMPRIKRGLLADDYSSGLLGAA